MRAKKGIIKEQEKYFATRCSRCHLILILKPDVDVTLNIVASGFPYLFIKRTIKRSVITSSSFLSYLTLSPFF